MQMIVCLSDICRRPPRDRWETNSLIQKVMLKFINLLPCKSCWMRLILNELPRSIALEHTLQEKYAKFNALLSLVGGIHTDTSHNHLYYFDPSQGRIEPIISDVNGHGLLLYPSPREVCSPNTNHLEVPLNGRNNPLFR